MKMNEDVKRKWVDALRSGEYQKGQHCLREKNEDGPDTFCCLGVLCDISGLGEWHAFGGVSELDYVVDRVSSTSYLPYPVQRWAGLTERNPEIDPEKIDYVEDVESLGRRLAHLNDSDGVTFADIANVIEEQL